VLATDMGNHAKIFSNFKRRLTEGQEWTSREDVKLALSMSLKMADISNCSRPTPIYLEWAKSISSEFYGQGDAEKVLKLSVSPFMNRSKHAADFASGQISFMNYIVLPMLEAMVEFLPKLDFTLEFCSANKDHWQHGAAPSAQ